MANMLSGTSTYNLLKKGLDVSNVRGKTIMNNIANVNTKGYKRQYVSFEEELKNSSQDIEISKTNKNHLEDDVKTNGISIKRDSSTSMRNDGNNVDIENEMVNVVANSMKYDALISQANTRLSMQKYVINGR